MAGRQPKKASLTLLLQDLNNRPVSARTKVVVSGKGTRKERYRASGRKGAVTRFTFELASGEWVVNVVSEGYEQERRLVSLGAGERRIDKIELEWVPPGGRGRANGRNGWVDESELIDGRLREFRESRSKGIGQFPFEGRARALEQKRHMVDPEVTNAPLIVKPVASPRPSSSLNDIGRWVFHSRRGIPRKRC